MQIVNEFKVDLPIDRTWQVLTDLEGVVTCLPGAQLTSVDGDTYSGKVKIKVGPITSEYAGTATFVEKDDAAYRAVISAKGRDARGAGNAAATIAAQLRSEGDHTVVSLDTDLKISGKIAQFGHSMIAEVSEGLLNQFVTNLEAKLAVSTEARETDGLTETNAPFQSQHNEPIDLMQLAGRGVAKRLVTPLIVVVVVVAVVIYLVVR
jgi:carbon monoxide dehydrogenase subunit G